MAHIAIQWDQFECFNQAGRACGISSTVDAFFNPQFQLPQDDWREQNLVDWRQFQLLPYLIAAISMLVSSR